MYCEHPSSEFLAKLTEELRALQAQRVVEEQAQTIGDNERPSSVIPEEIVTLKATEESVGMLPLRRERPLRVVDDDIMQQESSRLPAEQRAVCPSPPVVSVTMDVPNIWACNRTDRLLKKEPKAWSKTLPSFNRVLRRQPERLGGRLYYETLPWSFMYEAPQAEEEEPPFFEYTGALFYDPSECCLEEPNMVYDKVNFETMLVMEEHASENYDAFYNGDECYGRDSVEEKHATYIVFDYTYTHSPEIRKFNPFDC